jgi:hypothetical protein
MRLREGIRWTNDGPFLPVEFLFIFQTSISGRMQQSSQEMVPQGNNERRGGNDDILIDLTPEDLLRTKNCGPSCSKDTDNLWIIFTA